MGFLDDIERAQMLELNTTEVIVVEGGYIGFVGFVQKMQVAGKGRIVLNLKDQYGKKCSVTLDEIIEADDA